MMRFRFRPSACGLATLLATLAFGVPPRAAGPGSTESVLIGAFAPAVAMGPALPAGFSATVSLATRQRFVRVVADDIDKDGDLDVVANVGSLNLLVWENDGAGACDATPVGIRTRRRGCSTPASVGCTSWHRACS